MDILTLRSDFTPLKYIKYFNLQWNREYYVCGSFSMQILAVEYDPLMSYVYTKDRRETGIIQKIEYAETTEGTFVQLSGFFLEYILNDRIVHPVYRGSGNLEVSIRNCLTTYASDIPLLALGTLIGYNDIADWQRTGDELGKTFYELLKTKEMSYQCCLDYINNKILFGIYQGVDRTQNQVVNNYVVFSKGFRNLHNVSTNRDGSNYKNYAVVAGSGEGKDRITVDVDLSSGGYKKKVFIDARDLEYDTSVQTLAQYKENLKQRGTENLLDYVIIENTKVDVTNSNFKYLADFDVGDKVEVLIESLAVSLECRIISATEVIKQGTIAVTIELGDKKLTEYKKARLK